MWYAICVFLGAMVGAFIIGLLSRGKMQDYEQRLSWSETQRLRLQSRIDHEGDKIGIMSREDEALFYPLVSDELAGLAYQDDVKGKT